MKKLLFLSSLFLLVSCGDKYDAVKLSEKLTKEFGVPVEVQIEAKDLCGRRQLESLMGEYWYLTKPSRQVVKDKVQSYKKLVFAATEKVGELRGELNKLNFRKCSNGSCWTEVSKVLKDETFINGRAPVATVDHGEELIIKNESISNLVELTVYATSNLNAYTLVDDMGAQFQTALELGAVYHLNSDNRPGLDCAKSLKLVDIF